jgi:hypothetical protein
MPYVESDAISWVDYDPSSKSLAVRFRAAPVLYTHFDVPESVYEAFIAADSKNSFYQHKIAPVFHLDTPPLSQAGDGTMSVSETRPTEQ